MLLCRKRVRLLFRGGLYPVVCRVTASMSPGENERNMYKPETPNQNTHSTPYASPHDSPSYPSVQAAIDEASSCWLVDAELGQDAAPQSSFTISPFLEASSALSQSQFLIDATS